MCYFNLMPLYNTRNIMNNSTRLFDYLLSVSLGFDACLLSYPHSLCQSFPARQRACTLSVLCWGCHWHLCAMRRKDILQLQHSDSHSHRMALPRSEVLNTQVRPEETMVASSLVWSIAKGKNQLRGVFYIQATSLLSGSTRSPCSPMFPILLWPGFVPYGRW